MQKVEKLMQHKKAAAVAEAFLYLLHCTSTRIANAHLPARQPCPKRALLLLSCLTDNKMSTKTIIILFINLVLAVILAKLIFNTLKNFLRSIYYFLYPNIISILKKDYDNDFNYTHKLLLFIAIIIIILLLELYFFY